MPSHSEGLITPTEVDVKNGRAWLGGWDHHLPPGSRGQNIKHNLSHLPASHSIQTKLSTNTTHSLLMRLEIRIKLLNCSFYSIYLCTVL